MPSTEWVEVHTHSSTGLQRVTRGQRTSNIFESKVGMPCKSEMMGGVYSCLLEVVNLFSLVHVDILNTSRSH